MARATRQALILLMCIGAAACATREGYRQMVQSWVGAPIDALVQEWGVPSGQFQYADGTWDYLWTESWLRETPGTTRVDPVSGIVYRTDGDVYQRSCTTTFRTGPDRIIRSVSFEGSCVAAPK